MKRTIIDASQLELNDNVVSIKRVTKVVKGGRNMRFAALVVVGDGNGHVGAGVGKAAEIPEAIRKGKEDAIKHLVEFQSMRTVQFHMIFLEIRRSYSIIKESSRRYWYHRWWSCTFNLELAGIKNIRTKSLGSNNKQNVVLATIEGLKSMKTPEEVARLRGKSVSEILG